MIFSLQLINGRGGGIQGIDTNIAMYVQYSRFQLTWNIARKKENS
jgi:hypothetical protein